MKYEVLLFDIDNTLFDFNSVEEDALQKTFKEFGLITGLNDYRMDYQEISNILWRELEQGSITLEQLGVERFKRLFCNRPEMNAEHFSTSYLDHLSKGTALVEGAAELCKGLSHYRLAVITNGFTKVQKLRIKHSPLCNAFECIIISEEVGLQKPHKGIFEYACSKLHIEDKSKVLMIGDSLTSDIQGGIDFGIDTCWFNPNLNENNTEIKPTYEIHKLLNLLEIL